MRYTRQRNKTNCGPTAVMNALKWAGYSCSYKEFGRALKVRCGWYPGEGVPQHKIRYALCVTPELSVVQEKYAPNLGWIDKQLADDRAVLLCYYHKKGGHCALIVDKTENYYVLVNDSWTKTIMKRHRKTVNKMIKFGLGGNAWSLEAK